jgi:hypothetical protein
LNTCTSTTFQTSHHQSLRDVSLISFAFSQNIACKSLSSGVCSVSHFGVIFQTKISHSFTVAQILTIPSLSKFLSLASHTFGISLVVCSGHSFVSLTSAMYSFIWTESKIQFVSILSETMIASSKLYHLHGMYATRTFCHRASSQLSVAAQSTIISHLFTFCQLVTLHFMCIEVF